ncbi:unnamed protein product, partial [Rotaria sp. Silwood1]
MQELEETLGDRKKNFGKSNENDYKRNSKTNRKIEYKNKKFADVFNKKSNKWQRPSFHAQKGKKGKQESSRP